MILRLFMQLSKLYIYKYIPLVDYKKIKSCDSKHVDAVKQKVMFRIEQVNITIKEGK